MDKAENGGPWIVEEEQTVTEATREHPCGRRLSSQVFGPHKHWLCRQEERPGTIIYFQARRPMGKDGHDVAYKLFHTVNGWRSYAREDFHHHRDLIHAFDNAETFDNARVFCNEPFATTIGHTPLHLTLGEWTEATESIEKKNFIMSGGLPPQSYRMFGPDMLEGMDAVDRGEYGSLFQATAQAQRESEYFPRFQLTLVIEEKLTVVAKEKYKEYLTGEWKLCSQQEAEGYEYTEDDFPNLGPDGKPRRYFGPGEAVSIN